MGFPNNATFGFNSNGGAGGGGGSNAVVILGAGTGSSVRCGNGNVASGNYSTVLGRLNTGSGAYSTVSGYYSGASGSAATSFGLFNNAIGDNSFIGGGRNNTTNSSESAIVGGRFNSTSDSSFNAIVGGYCNNNFGLKSVVLGGDTNVLCGTYSYLSGCQNNSLGQFGIINGFNNLDDVSASNSFLNGSYNYENGSYVFMNGCFNNNGGSLYQALNQIGADVCVTGDLSLLFSVGSSITYYNNNDDAYVNDTVVSSSYDVINDWTVITGNASFGADSVGYIRVNSGTGGFFNYINGFRNNITGSNVIVNGNDNSINNGYNIVIGGVNNVTSSMTTVVGCLNTISGNYQTVFGYSNTISGGYNFSAGGSNTISGTYNGIFGYNNRIFNARSFAYGSCNTICSSHTLSGGYYNTASSTNGVVMGMCNRISNVATEKDTAFATVLNGTGHNTTGGSFDFANVSWTISPTVCCSTSKFSFIGNGFQHRINTECFGFIGNGYQNVALNNYAAVVSGLFNSNSGRYGFIGNGESNVICAATIKSSIVNGQQNLINVGSFTGYSSILGGFQNCLSASNSVIGGGQLNNITATRGGILGGRSNTVSGSYAFIGAGRGGAASGVYSGIGSGFTNQSQGGASFVGGGICNNVCNTTSTCLATGSFIGGGIGNNTTGGTFDFASCSFTVAPTVCSTCQFTFIGGGFQNLALGIGSSVVGGCRNLVGTGGCYSVLNAGYLNQVTTKFGHLGGGFCNIINGNTSTLSGGYRNTVSGGYAAVVGGWDNIVCGAGGYGFIGAGRLNKVSGNFSGVLGGCANNACLDCSFIVGYGLTSDESNTTFMNNLKTGGIRANYCSVTANYSLLQSDFVVDITANSVCTTLPTAVGITGKVYVVKNSGAGVGTICTTSAQTIDGAADKTVAAKESFMVQSTGANWIII